LENCRQILTRDPLFVVMTVYAFRASPLSLHNAVSEMMSGRKGTVFAGESAMTEKHGGRTLSTAIYARWMSEND